MSGGQQQRLMIARALIHEPQVIFLDEPTVGLDPQTRLSLWEILRELHNEGRTIVMTTHYMDEADKLCDRIAIVDQGKLLELDTPAALKQRAPGRHARRAHAGRRRGARRRAGARDRRRAARRGEGGRRFASTATAAGASSRRSSRPSKTADATVTQHQSHRAEPRDAVRLAHREEARLTALARVALRAGQRARPCSSRCCGATCAWRARSCVFFLVRTTMQPLLFLIVFGFLLPKMNFRAEGLSDGAAARHPRGEPQPLGDPVRRAADGAGFRLDEGDRGSAARAGVRRS